MFQLLETIDIWDTAVYEQSNNRTCVRSIFQLLGAETSSPNPSPLYTEPWDTAVCVHYNHAISCKQCKESYCKRLFIKKTLNGRVWY